MTTIITLWLAMQLRFAEAAARLRGIESSVAQQVLRTADWRLPVVDPIRRN